MDYDKDEEKNEIEEWNKAKEKNETEDLNKEKWKNEAEQLDGVNEIASENESEVDDFEEIKRSSKKGIIGLALLTVLLFIFGVSIGRRLLIMDEKPTVYKRPKNVAEKKIENTIENVTVEEQNTVEIEEKVAEEESEEDLIVYARYKLQDSNDENKECEITFGKGANFSFDLGKDGAYIYGNYHIDGDIITCNAITWRNVERTEPINSTLKFKIIEKNLVQISEVEIYESDEGLDKELINLDGLKVGLQYKYEKKVSTKNKAP